MNLEKAQPLALVLFARQFATLINIGVPIRHCLTILSKEAKPPYEEAMREISQAVEEGQPSDIPSAIDPNRLMQAFSEYSELFPPVYLILMRAGLIGKMLDETLMHGAELLEESWKFARLSGSTSVLNSILAPEQVDQTRTWDDMTEENRTFILMIFCRTFGLLLSSGVPILQSMELTAEILPPVQRDAWLDARQKVRDGARASVAEFLPYFVLMLVRSGEETGTLNVMMLQAADYYHHALEAECWGRLQMASGDHH